MATFDELMAQCKSAKDDVIAWRRHIHQHPELSFHEFETAKYIAHVLESFACPQLTIQRPLPNAVLADLRGGAGDGPIIALRADIDALPLEEEVDVPFKSTNKNVMHACGHDTHTAMLLGAAKVLCANWRALKGTVRFMFQHAEEVPPGGAPDLVKAGAMKDVQHTFGLHVMPTHPTGIVALKNGTMTSSADSITIRIRGRGGHASMPQVLVDPVPIAAEVVLALQTIVARKVDPLHAPVLSLATMTTGPNESHNVIPDEVKLMGTVRTQDRDVRKTVHAEIERIVKGITEAHNATYKVDTLMGYDMVDNDPAVTDRVRSIAKRIVGHDNLVEMEHALFAGEDYSIYAGLVPSCFALIGVVNAAKHHCGPIHSATFYVDEDAFPIGVSLHVGFVHEYLIA